MPNVHQIQERLAAWTDHDISLAEFEDWFVPATWNIHKSGDKAAEDLVNEIELNLSEHSDVHMSDEELRAAMRRLVASINPIIVWTLDWTMPVRYSSSSPVVETFGMADRLMRV